MRRLTSWLLIVCFAALGTGAMQHLHRLQHAAADAAAAHQACSHDAGSTGSPAPHVPGSDRVHHEQDCPLCVQLHQAACAPAPALTCLGVFEPVGSVELAPQEPAVSIHLAAAVCRGPPSAFVAI